ncbi:hypothetical protein K458DRAFT_457041 [Lentithecium fluviatile CBS 122367]|uniref:Uncharacterized protein n=1 Tax=Lentithecium fluviatile CBS 122367 TaxID=1168545 RepID=A0A6G1IT85_9PLEO|nr:hypothetical protein K458DRAFT_457041 [Lentithecium fluviatile CBS 122367]
MTLVFSSLGHLVQGQFGINEVASSVVVSKVVGSLFSRQADGNSINQLAQQYDLFVRDIPKYLLMFAFEHSGTVLGDRQRRNKVSNVMEGVELSSVEGIATIIVLLLRHIESPSDIVDYLEDLLKGKFWLVRRPRNDYPQTLPFAMREILQTFVGGVIDADADSPQANSLRNLLAKLVVLVGSSKFLESVAKPSQLKQEQILSWLLDNPSGRKETDEGYPVFHTLSAGAVMIALAAAANGANLRVQCTTDDANGRPNEVVLHDVRSRQSGNDALLIVHLWLSQPPPGVATILRSILTREEFASRTIFSGALPVHGGMAEISKLVSQQIRCKNSSQECLELWERGVATGTTCSWAARMDIRESRPTLVYSIDPETLELHMPIPPSLKKLANDHLKVPKNDTRHKLARRAASVMHEVLRYPEYEGYNEQQLECTLNFIQVAIFTGWMGKLAINPSEALTHYAWTADCDRFLGFAQTSISQGLTLNRILLIAARIWGGVTPSFAPDIASDRMVMGIARPQATILVNVLSNPEAIANHGIAEGLFTLHQGSIPTLPRDQHSGLILAGTKRFRKPAQSLDARDQIPMASFNEQKLLFTVEPVKGDDGILAAVLCVWQHGDAIMELNPYHVLCGLTGQRKLQQPLPVASSLKRLFNISHMSSRELLQYSDGYTVFNGISLIRAGSRVDLQIAAAGSHSGSRTIMIVSDEDADYIRNTQKIKHSGGLGGMRCVLELGENDDYFDDRTAIIFCRDDFPPDLGAFSELVQEDVEIEV